MIGVGFGGCIVLIVYKDVIEEFVRKVGENYCVKIGFIVYFYIFEIDDGVREIEI